MLLKYTFYSDDSGFPDGVDTANTPYLLNDSLLDDYENITSISNYDKYWMFLNKDYKFIRVLIINLVASTGYSSLSSNEKYLAAKWFAVDMSLPLLDSTISYNNIDPDRDFTELSNRWDISSKTARSIRFSKAKAQLLSRLGKSHGFTVLSDLKADNAIDDYVENGRDGIETGSPEGLWDYIQSTVGTSWEHTGLSTKGWTPLDGSTLSNVVTTVMNILRDGNY